MNEKDNPYFNLLEIMGNQAPEQQKIIHFGKVINLSPLQISINEIILDQNDLLLNSNLKFYDSSIIGKTTDYININDNVVLISEDFQTFILMCKVV